MLKNTLKLAFASILFLTSCSNDDNAAIVATDDDKKDVENVVKVNATNANTTERTADIKALPATTVPVIVEFTKENKTLNRLYVTQTVSGSNEGPVAYDIDPNGTLKLSKKADGSVDLEGDQEKAFSFKIDFPAPATTNGTVQYIIWATSQRGDFRDLTNDNSYEDNTTHAVITITAGTAAEVSGYREFEQTITLEAPLADASSKTFVSAFNGAIYSIKGAQETAALWDFGYFYDNTFGASFYSTATFPASGFTDPIETVTGIAKSELNKCYFGKSTKTAAEFDAVNTAAGLNNSLTTASKQDTSSFNAANALEVNDVVEFMDQYGNKGLIKITALTKGTGVKGRITFRVKVQAKATPIKG